MGTDERTGSSEESGHHSLGRHEFVSFCETIPPSGNLLLGGSDTN